LSLTVRRKKTEMASLFSSHPVERARMQIQRVRTIADTNSYKVKVRWLAYHMTLCAKQWMASTRGELFSASRSNIHPWLLIHYGKYFALYF